MKYQKGLNGGSMAKFLDRNWPTILLLLGSVLMLAKGFGLLLSKYAFFAGVGCVIISVFIEVILKKQFDNIL